MGSGGGRWSWGTPTSTSRSGHGSVTIGPALSGSSVRTPISTSRGQATLARRALARPVPVWSGMAALRGAASILVCLPVLVVTPPFCPIPGQWLWEYPGLRQGRSFCERRPSVGHYSGRREVWWSASSWSIWTLRASAISAGLPCRRGGAAGAVGRATSGGCASTGGRWPGRLPAGGTVTAVSAARAATGSR